MVPPPFLLPSPACIFHRSAGWRGKNMFHSNSPSLIAQRSSPWLAAQPADHPCDWFALIRRLAEKRNYAQREKHSVVFVYFILTCTVYVNGACPHAEISLSFWYIQTYEKSFSKFLTLQYSGQTQLSKRRMIVLNSFEISSSPALLSFIRNKSTL